MNASTVVSILGGLAIIAGGILAALFGHSTAAEPPWSQRYGYYPGDDIDRYAHHQPTARTPHGVAYDGWTDPTRIDRVVDSVEVCLGQAIDRSRFVVLVPGDWTLNCDRSHQVLPVRAPSAGCHDSGCGTGVCHWRAVVAEPNVLVAPPSLYLLQDALLRFLFDEPDPYGNARLAPCTAPVTGPLDT